MSDQTDVIDAIKLDAAACGFAKVHEKDISEEGILSTELPALVISQIDTTFAGRNDKQTNEEYDVKLMIMLKDDTATPRDDLLVKQKLLITTMLTKGSNLRKVVVTDGIELKEFCKQ